MILQIIYLVLIEISSCLKYVFVVNLLLINLSVFLSIFLAVLEQLKDVLIKFKAKCLFVLPIIPLKVSSLLYFRWNKNGF